HPNVVTVHEVGSHGDRDYIVIELVDGESLDDWLAIAPPRDLGIDALLQAGRGRPAARAAGVGPRDFKPKNILRSNNGRVVVTDFGLARSIAEQYTRWKAADHGAVDSTSMTETGSLLGTPAFMPAEQFAGAPPDARSDQFAFCVTA